MIILLAIAVIAVSAPIGGVILVSLASRREDAANSLSSMPTGTIQSFGRRMVGFHGDGVCQRPVRRTGTTSRPSGRDNIGAFHGSTGLASVSDSYTGHDYSGEDYSGDDYQLPPALTGGYLIPPPRTGDLADVPHLVG